MSAVSVEASTAFTPKAWPGSSPRTALHELRVTPIALGIAKRVLTKHHYLHSLPGGTQLSFGVFLGKAHGSINNWLWPFSGLQTGDVSHT